MLFFIEQLLLQFFNILLLFYLKFLLLAELFLDWQSALFFLKQQALEIKRWGIQKTLIIIVIIEAKTNLALAIKGALVHVSAARLKFVDLVDFKANFIN